MGQVVMIGEENALFKERMKEAHLGESEGMQNKEQWIGEEHKKIKNAQNTIKILVKTILATDSTLIMMEATKALRVLAKREDVIHLLWEDGALIEILDQKFMSDADPMSQENFLHTLA